MSRVLLSLLLTLSFHSLISQRHLRTFRGVRTFPALFSMLVFLFPSLISLPPCLAPSKRCSDYIHVLKALLLLSFLSSIFSSLSFSLLLFLFSCFAIERAPRTYTRPKALPLWIISLTPQQIQKTFRSRKTKCNKQIITKIIMQNKGAYRHGNNTAVKRC